LRVEGSGGFAVNRAGEDSLGFGNEGLEFGAWELKVEGAGLEVQSAGCGV